ncbi:MAG: hypothetical protein WDA59_07315 [Methanofastidiosum sp.]|jgi:hypothetical protein
MKCIKKQCEGYVMEIDGKEFPVDPEVVLGLCKEQAPKEILQYWEGWQAANFDAITKTLNK